jgi:hypothetical protein
MDVLSKLKFPEDDFSVYWFEYLLNTLYVPICGNRNATCASCDQSRSRLKLFAESFASSTWLSQCRPSSVAPEPAPLIALCSALCFNVNDVITELFMLRGSYT